MTAPKRPTSKPIAPSSIAEQLGNCISEGQNWLTAADAGTVCLALKLAKLIDSIIDSGTDLDKLAALIGRLGSLLRELKLTPLARDASKASAEEVDSGIEYAQTYLRLVSASDSKPKTSRAKSGTTSKRPSK